MPNIIPQYQQQVGVAGVPSSAARVRNPEVESSGFRSLAVVAEQIAARLLVLIEQSVWV